MLSVSARSIALPKTDNNSHQVGEPSSPKQIRERTCKVKQVFGNPTFPSANIPKLSLQISSFEIPVRQEQIKETKQPYSRLNSKLLTPAHPDSNGDTGRSKLNRAQVTEQDNSDRNPKLAIVIQQGGNGDTVSNNSKRKFSKHGQQQQKDSDVKLQKRKTTKVSLCSRGKFCFKDKGRVFQNFQSPLPPSLFPNNASTFVKRRFIQTVEKAATVEKAQVNLLAHIRKKTNLLREESEIFIQAKDKHEYSEESSSAYLIPFAERTGFSSCTDEADQSLSYHICDETGSNQKQENRILEQNKINNSYHTQGKKALERNGINDNKRNEKAVESDVGCFIPDTCKVEKTVIVSEAKNNETTSLLSDGGTAGEGEATSDSITGCESESGSEYPSSSNGSKSDGLTSEFEYEDENENEKEKEIDSSFLKGREIHEYFVSDKEKQNFNDNFSQSLEENETPGGAHKQMNSSDRKTRGQKGEVLEIPLGSSPIHRKGIESRRKNVTRKKTKGTWKESSKRKALRESTLSKDLQNGLKTEFSLVLSASTRDRWVSNENATKSTDARQMRQNKHASIHSENKICHEIASVLKGSNLDESTDIYEDGVNMEKAFDTVGRIRSQLMISHLLIAKFPSYRKEAYYIRIKIYAKIGWWKKVIEDCKSILQIDQYECRARFLLVQGLLRSEVSFSPEAILKSLQQLDFIISKNHNSKTADIIQACRMMCELKILLTNATFCNQGNVKDYLMSAKDNIDKAIIACTDTFELIGNPISSNQKLRCLQTQAYLATILGRRNYINSGKCKEIVKSNYLKCISLLSGNFAMQNRILLKLVDFFIEIRALDEVEEVISELKQQQRGENCNTKIMGNILGNKSSTEMLTKQQHSVGRKRRGSVSLSKEERKHSPGARTRRGSVSSSKEHKRGSVARTRRGSVSSSKEHKRGSVARIQLRSVSLSKARSKQFDEAKSFNNAANKTRNFNSHKGDDSNPLENMLAIQIERVRFLRSKISESSRLKLSAITRATLKSIVHTTMAAESSFLQKNLTLGRIYCGYLNIFLGHYSEALKAIEMCSETQFKSVLNVKLQCMTAFLLCKLCQPVSAMKQLVKATEKPHTLGETKETAEAFLFMSILNLDFVFDPGRAIKSSRRVIQMVTKEPNDAQYADRIASWAAEICVRAHCSTQNYAGAINICSQLILRQPHKSWPYLIRGRLLHQNHSHILGLSDALAYLSLESQQGILNVSTTVKILKILKKTNEAYRLAQKADSRNPSIENLLLLCELIHEIEGEKEAKRAKIRELINRNVKQFENDISIKKYDIDSKARAELNIAISYHSIGAHEEAIAHYGRTLELRPNHGQALIGRGSCYLQQVICKAKIQTLHHNYHHISSFKLSMKDFEELIEAEPDNIDAYLNVAIIYQKCGEYRSAIEVLDTALEINPENKEAIMNKTVLLHFVGSTACALKEIDRVLHCQETTASDVSLESEKQLWCNTGIMYMSMNNKDHAHESFMKALEIDEQFLPAIIGYSVLHLLSYDNPDVALRGLESILEHRQLLRSTEKQARLQLSIGNCLYKLGYIKEAHSQFHRVVKSYKGGHNVISVGAMIGEIACRLYDIFNNKTEHEEEEEEEEEEKELEMITNKLVKLIGSQDPSCVPAHVNLGHVFLYTGQVDKAQTFYRSALALLRAQDASLKTNKFGKKSSLENALQSLANGTLFEDTFISSSLCLMKDGKLISAFSEARVVMDSKSEPPPNLKMKKFWALINHVMGNCLIAYKQYKEIIQQSDSCIQSAYGDLPESVPEKPDVLLNSDIRILLSSLCLRMRRPKEALYHTHHILKSHRASPNALLNQGIAHVILGHTEQALGPISIALEMIDSRRRKLNKNKTTGENSSQEKRRNIVEPGIPLSKMYYNRCIARFLLQMLDDAKNDCDEAIYLDPSNPTLYWLRAEIYAAVSLKREAMQNYHSAIKLCRNGGGNSLDPTERRVSVTSIASVLTAGTK